MNSRSIEHRIYEIPLVFIGTSLLLFFIFHFIGGDSALQLAGKYATAETLNQYRTQLGIDQPLWWQYAQFLKEILTFNFGSSWASGHSVHDLIFRALKPTLLLTVPAFLLSFIISCCTALIMTHFNNTVIDRFLQMVCFTLLSLSFLVFVICAQYYFSYLWGWFPISGWTDEPQSWIKYLALPILIYASISFAKNALIFKALFVDEISKPHVSFSRSKGIGPSKILYKHVLYNCWPTMAALLSSQIPSLFLGALILENFFGIPGIGNLTIDAFNEGDFPLLKGITVFGSLIYSTIFLVADTQLSQANGSSPV